ncbi:hypothetical protein SUGI_0176130 [Cryptomeria japonica]|nr:hypothetical protein SUGI_0176130 [Cryptomeria japonica]
MANVEFPLDLDYMIEWIWNTSFCRSVQIDDNVENCRTTLRTVFGVGIFQYLKEKSLFELPDYASTTACSSVCDGIEIVEDWNEKVGVTSVDMTCKGDLSSYSACAMNEFGPKNKATSSCVLQVEFAAEGNSHHRVLIHGLMGAFVGFLLLTSLGVGCLLWAKRKGNAKHIHFVRLNKSFRKSVVKPNMGTVWFSEFNDIKKIYFRLKFIDALT